NNQAITIIISTPPIPQTIHQALLPWGLMLEVLSEFFFASNS
ncbi:4732_t:CDS:1, partial [Ambispora leptoticha]